VYHVELDSSPQMEKTNVPNVDHQNLTVLRVTTHVAAVIATKAIKRDYVYACLTSQALTNR
jgi:hypothetical protein